MTQALLDALLEVETEVWEALKSGDAEADAALLSEDFVGVYPMGISGRDGHADQVSDGPSVVDYALSEVQVMDLGAGQGMLIYRADYLRPGEAKREAMYVSSLWRRAEGGWMNVFSQDTPVSDTPVP